MFGRELRPLNSPTNFASFPLLCLSACLLGLLSSFAGLRRKQSLLLHKPLPPPPRSSSARPARPSFHSLTPGARRLPLLSSWHPWAHALLSSLTGASLPRQPAATNTAAHHHRPPLTSNHPQSPLASIKSSPSATCLSHLQDLLSLLLPPSVSLSLLPRRVYGPTQGLEGVCQSY